ncbi:MAG: helix-turn-helix domain-containing protein [Christensenella sp.]
MKKKDVSLEKSCRLIQNALGINCSVEDVWESCVPDNPFCRECLRLQKKYGVEKNCAALHTNSAFQSEKWGGKYEYLCPLGLCFIASGVPLELELRYAIIAGPFFMVDLKEFAAEDLQNVFHKKDTRALLKIAENVGYIACNRVSYLAEMINIVTKSAAAAIRSSDLIKNEAKKPLERVHDLIYEHKDLKETLESQMEMEKVLLNHIKLKNREEAQELLNEILGGIYFHSFGDLKIIKARVTELVVGLLRAAVSSGIGIENVFALSGDYISEIQQFENIRDLNEWLTKVLNSIMFSVFPNSHVRLNAIVEKVRNYIEENYMKKISLNELANLAGFSVSYLSKIFKEETQKSISAYINHVRIENAKKLLRTTDISLVELAYVVGFEEQSYFTKVFKKLEGVSPGKYRDSNVRIVTK